MASVNLPYRSSMPGLGNHRTGNLKILFEEGRQVQNCGICKHSIKDILCFCKKCEKYLHLKCAGVGYSNYTHHGKNQVMLPRPEELPKSCHECLRITPIDQSIIGRNTNALTNLSLQHQTESSASGSLRHQSISSMMPNENWAANLSLQLARSISSRRSIVGSCNSIRIPKSAPTVPSSNDHQERSIVGSNNSIRLKSTNQSTHNLVENANCLIHTSMPGHELQKKHCGTVYKCFGCKEKGFGSQHVCQNASCSFRLHEYCKSPPKSIKHDFFHGLRFDFSYSPKIKYCNQCEMEHSTVNCNACGMDVNGYFYQSNDGTKHLHPCCANLPHQIQCGESGTIMKLKPNTTSKCSYCHEATMMVGNKQTAQIWSYVSQCRNNIHLHVPCMIKMLSDFEVIDSTSSRANGSTSLLTLHKKTEVNNMTTKLEFQIAAAADARKKWETKFKTIMKYAKIVLGAIISACLGDPTPFNLNCIVAFIS